MSYRVIRKSDFPRFLEKLSSEFRVMYPHEKEPGQFVFRETTQFADMPENYVYSMLPPKKLFFPQHETLLEFDLSAGVPVVDAVVEAKPIAVVGVHPCDLHGLQCLDMVFEDENPDPNFMKKRQEAVVIGFNCMPDSQCFCASIGTIKPPEKGFDLFMTDVGARYAVEIGSAKGESTLERFAETGPIDASDLAKINQWYEKKKGGQKLEVVIDSDDLPLLFGGGYHDTIWEELGQKCLSCGACNLVCPTCYCFDVHDEVEISNLEKGRRCRVWDGCQLEEFAAVAGGENFRERRKDRNRHRFYRKFVYPVLKYKQRFCVGCGRCVRSCLVHISVVDTVNHFAAKNMEGGAQ